MKTPTWIVAVKCVSRDRLNKKAEQNVLTECRLLSIIEHPYIVKLFSYEVHLNHNNLLTSKNCFIPKICETISEFYSHILYI